VKNCKSEKNWRFSGSTRDKNGPTHTTAIIAAILAGGREGLRLNLVPQEQ